MEPALEPDTTRGSSLVSSSARTTPKCLHHRAGSELGVVAWHAGEPQPLGRPNPNPTQLAPVARSNPAQPAEPSPQRWPMADSPEAKGAAAAEHQAGAAKGVAHFTQEGLPVLQRQLCRSGVGAVGQFISR